MLMFCTVLASVNFFGLIKTGMGAVCEETSASLFSFFQRWGGGGGWGTFFPTGIQLSLPSEVNNAHFEFFDASTQGYEEVSQKFTSIRRVRGDNYCALRATLFQAMSQPAALPSWLQDPELTLVRCCCRFESAMFPSFS